MPAQSCKATLELGLPPALGARLHPHGPLDPQPHPVHPSHCCPPPTPSPQPPSAPQSQAKASLVLTTNSLEFRDLHPDFPQGRIHSDFLRRDAHQHVWDLHVICIHAYRPARQLSGEVFSRLLSPPYLCISSCCFEPTLGHCSPLSYF